MDTDTATLDDALDVEALYQRYRGPLYALCLARLGDRELAEDVVQDAFADALAVLPRFDRQRPFWPWLVSIAVGNCIDAQRKRARAASRHGELAAVAGAGATDLTARSALGKLAHEAVWEELERLPPRQRAALQLFAVDGWSYAHIADRLGCSVGTVKLLIVRGRTRLRRVRGRVLSGLGPAAQGLAGRLQGVLERAATVARWPAAASGAWLHGVEGSAAVVAAVLVAVVGLSLPARGAPTSAPTTAPAPAAAPVPGTTTAGPPDAPSRASGHRAPPEPAVQAQRRAAERTVNETAASLSPSSDEAAEDQQYQSLAVSPGYDDDRTVFVVDAVSRLSVSHDGGASWTRVRALGLKGRRILLPPAYPRDGRIFSFGTGGLQMSDNGGNTFETLAPHSTGHAAMSPGFDGDDPTVLLAGVGMLWRYDAVTGSTHPVLLDERLADHEVTGIRYDTDDPRHRTVRLLTRAVVAPSERAGWVQAYASSISRCTLPEPAPAGSADLVRAPSRLTCTATTRLGSFQAATAGLSAATTVAGPLFVGGQNDVLVSTDDGSTFRPVARWGGLWDLAPRGVGAVPSMPTAAVMARFTRPGEPALLRTDDAGASWTPLYVDAPGFEARNSTSGGANGVAVTPTGRIIALGAQYGLACSVDGGRTWAPLCPTADT
jgi:RNA polymerase sigma-70 factor (ECF subfamily)